MKVLNHISGSYCVVELGPDSYIDAQKDARYPDHTFIEVVQGGHCRKRVCVHNTHLGGAPEEIIKLMRETIH